MSDEQLRIRQQSEAGRVLPAAAPAPASLHERLMLAEAAGKLFGGGEPTKVHVGRYLVLDAIGSGGMGTVYRAYDPKLERRVALKVLRADAVNADDRRGRLQREALALAQLSHPNVVAIHEVVQDAREVFIAMEYVPGCDLAQWAIDNPPGDRARLDTALRLLIGAGRGLAAAHRVGLIHRDIKPANILVGQDGRARVADFGLARRTTTVSAPKSQPPGSRTRLGTPDVDTASGVLMGTPRYASPEQQRGGEVDTAADQFSFCVAAWELLFGASPWPGVPEASNPPSARGGRLRWLAVVLLRGLQARPSDRFASMDALVNALEDDPRRRRHRQITWAAVIAVSAGLVAGAAQRRATRCDPPDEAAMVAARPERSAAVQSVFDDYTSRWRRTFRQVCEAETAQLADGQREAAGWCLDLAEASVQGVALAAIDAESVAQLVVSPSLCWSAPAVFSAPPPQGDREQTRQDQRIVAEASAWRTAGHEERARVVFGRLGDDTGRTRHAAVELAARQFQAQTALLDGEHGAAKALCDQGYRRALLLGDATVAAEFAAQLQRLADVEGDLEAVEQWRRHVRLLEQALPVPPR